MENLVVSEWQKINRATAFYSGRSTKFRLSVWDWLPISFNCILIVYQRASDFNGSRIEVGLPWWLSGKESACNAGTTGDAGLIPGSGRSLGGGYGNPLQYSCLENPMDRGAWQATVHRVAKSQTWLKRPSIAQNGGYDCKMQTYMTHMLLKFWKV